MNSLTVSVDTNLIAADKQPLSFERLVAIFMEGKDMKPSSAQAYRGSFGKFGAFLHDQGIQFAREQDVKHFKEALTESGLSTFTVISHIGALKSLFSFASTRNLYPNIAADIKTPKKPKGFQRDSLRVDEAKRLIKSTLGDDLGAKRDHAIINTLLRCGLRSIEIIRADIGDIRRQGDVSLLYVHGKGRDSKDEFVVLTKEAEAAINAYLGTRRGATPADPLFACQSPRNKNGRLSTRSIRRLVKDHMSLIGINNPRLTCHSLRHTFATLALASGALLLSVKEAMRHNDITTTTIYAHMQDRMTKGAEHFIKL